MATSKRQHRVDLPVPNGLSRWRGTVPARAWAALVGYDGPVRAARNTMVLERWAFLAERHTPALTVDEWLALVALLYPSPGTLWSLDDVRLLWARIDEAEREGKFKRNGHTCGAELLRKVRSWTPLEAFLGVDVVERFHLLGDDDKLKLDYPAQIRKAGGQIKRTRAAA